MVLPILVALLSVNLLTMLRFAQDKAAARAGAWRVSEAELLGLALIGGSAGALLARKLWRHKTRKQPFSTLLFLIVAVQIGVTIGLLA